MVRKAVFTDVKAVEETYNEHFAYGGFGVIRGMTEEDYDELFAMWADTPNMGLRSLDDSREGICRFLKRNPATNFVAYEDSRIVGAIRNVEFNRLPESRKKELKEFSDFLKR